jgi:hypothetical protein
MNDVEEDGDDVVQERPEYYAIEVRLLDCKPGNMDDPNGEPCTIVTISRGCDGDVIEPLLFAQHDARELITKALVALATCEDEFAQKLLGSNFNADDNGDFIWPDD